MIDDDKLTIISVVIGILGLFVLIGWLVYRDQQMDLQMAEKGLCWYGRAYAPCTTK